MKRIVSAAAAICLLLTVLLLISCGELLQNVISDLESSIENETSESSVRQTEATSPIDTETATDGPDSIPYKSEPSVSKYKMPEEEFTDPVEKEASEIIDGAISRALGCL